MATLLEIDHKDAALQLRALELLNVGSWSWTVATDELQWSDQMYRLMGFEPHATPLSYEAFLSFLSPVERRTVRELTQQALRDKTGFEVQYRAHRTDGKVRVLHARASVAIGADGTVTHLTGAAIDVTDLARQREKLAASEERFRSVFEQSAVGMALTDRYRVFTRVNASFARLLGYEPGELIGKCVTDITHPDDLGLTNERLDQIEQEAQSSTYEKRYIRRDGSTVWARTTPTHLRSARGAFAGFLGVIQDITERRAATEALMRQSEVLKRILDSLPVMVAMFGRDGQLLFANPAWEKTIGWTLEEAKELDVHELIFPSPEDRAHARQAAQAASGEWIEYHPTTRDGRKLTTSVACIRLSDGTSLRIGADVTERRELQQRLVQAQKMEALGQLAGGVAHDFNNLLTVISACAQFVQEAVEDRPKVTEDVKEIVVAANRAAALTRQLLAFSRRQMLKPEMVNVNNALHTMSKTLGRLIGENIQLAIMPGATHATVEVDVHQLEQVLLNLAVNARDAIEGSGTITIETFDVPSWRDPSGRDHIAITVSDDGCGIDPAIRDRIFEPFFTTKGLGKGTGLGLATVFGIVEQSGGRIDVDSEVGKGTTFRVLLPLVAADKVAGTDRHTPEVLSGKETVLLVEDEAPLRAVARRTLTSFGYTVLEARHGADAMRIAASHEGSIDVLVTDVVMPIMGGRELVQRMRGVRPGMPVLYISGYTDDELLRKGILEPDARLLRKPFLPIELASAVRELLTCSLAASSP